MQLVPIGHLETPWATLADCPRGIDAAGPPCRVVVAEDYALGLWKLRRGQRIVLLYWLDAAERQPPLVQRRRGYGELKGLFALRTPHRPNPIGLAEVVIERIEGAVLHVRGLDCRNGTPLLDIKPA